VLDDVLQSLRDVEGKLMRFQGLLGQLYHLFFK
jgi:hypothetical protein